MIHKSIKGRLFFFMLLAVFFILGGPALAREAEAPPPTAVLRAKSYVYTGEVQYVTLDSLSHPMEAEGQYSFSWYKNGILLSCAGSVLPIRTVSDSGIYYCKVSFTINGKTADTITDSVEIKVQKKEVDVSPISPLVYTGYRQYPPLYETAEYRVDKNEGALEAGKYSVLLSLKDGENFCFPSLSGAEISEDGKQMKLPYTVERAENSFSTPLSVPPCYEGSAPSPQAFSKFGEVTYRYYSDPEGAYAIAPPTRCGTYYVRAFVAESASVLALASPLVSFEIRPLTVVALRALSLPSRLTYDAFDSFSLDGASLVATMSDGSVRAVPRGEITVIYPLGKNCLLAKDTHVFLSYGGIGLPISVSVSRIPLDLSSAVWSEQGWVYDGTEREITLSGLPVGVSVSAYRDNHVVDAGEHTVVALLSFDGENYDGPQSLSYNVSVARRGVPIPSLSPAVYCGTLLFPSVPSSPFYEAKDLPRALHAGLYPVSLALTDPKNYCFEGTADSAIELFFEVLPLELRVCIDSVSLYLGEKFSLPQYRVIAGTVAVGDDLGFGAKKVSGSYEYYFENPDYAVTYEGGAVERTYRLPPAAESALFLGGAALLFITLTVFSLILLYRKRVRPMPRGAARSPEGTCTYPLFSKQEPERLHVAEDAYRLEQRELPAEDRASDVFSSEQSLPEEDPEKEDTEHSEAACVDAVDVSTADALITDALAEALVMAEERVIYTEGSRHGVINVDTLSAAFAPGEEVDINRLKKKRLIAKDVGYLKVLARGSINKPLTVYADDFSLGAIKMIALTGGRTFHVKTKPLP